MSSFQALRIPVQLSFNRRVSLALELLDAVTLQRVNQGATVIAEGFRGKPVQNASGVFVWIGEDIAQLRSISINTGHLPLEGTLLPAASVKRPLTTIELSPRLNYPFTTGVTGLSGSLVELRGISPSDIAPVVNAKVSLSWIDEEGVWQDSLIRATTDSNGDFVSIIRFASSQKPMLDVAGFVTTRLNIARDGRNSRRSSELKFSLGRITNPSIAKPLIFVWNELLP